MKHPSYDNAYRYPYNPESHRALKDAIYQPPVTAAEQASLMHHLQQMDEAFQAMQQISDGLILRVMSLEHSLEAALNQLDTLRNR
jgi:hypothetical protein